MSASSTPWSAAMPGRLAEVADDVELFSCDVRDEDSLASAFKGADVVMHLAAINGTENFYKHPELVLDVGIRGAIAVVNAGRTAGVPELGGRLERGGVSDAGDRADARRRFR